MKCKKRVCSEGWQGKFHKSGYRMTASRESVIKVLQETMEHLSAEEIFIKARAINPNIGLTTVYRTLEKLNDMGEIQKIVTIDNRAVYELANSEKGHHYHLICTKCKRIIDYNDLIDEEVKLLKNVEKKLAKKYNFKINSHLIQFYGECKNCS